MPKKKDLPVKAQEAAVKAMLDAGSTAEDILKDHPDLAEGLNNVVKHAAQPPAPRRSGSSRATLSQPPRGLR